jgi:hypothetical protein
MGQPAISIQLVDATPYRLRYLLVDSGNGGNVVLTNRGPTEATPDLRGDATRAAAGNNQANAPLLAQVSLAVVNQAEARHVLAGHQTPTTPEAANIVRAHMKVSPKLGRDLWIVDTDEGAAAGDAPSAGFPVVIVGSEGIAGGAAYLDIHLTHTEIDSQ